MNDVTSLANQLASGLASEEATGIALRTLQTALASDLLTSLQRASDLALELDTLLEQAVQTFSVKVQEQIDSDTIATEDLFDIIDKLQSKQLQVLDIKRKIVQSPTKLFPDDLLSSEERKFLSLLKSFSTEEEKRDFLKAVSAYFSTKNNF